MTRSPFAKLWGGLVVSGSLLVFLAVSFSFPIDALTSSPSAATSASRGHGWAGLEVNGPANPNIWGAFGTWVVPIVTCPATGSSALSTWVGVGGAHVGDILYQAGVTIECERSSARYTAFYETFNANTSNDAPTCLGPLGLSTQPTSCFSVKPGDTIKGDVVDEHHHIPGVGNLLYVRYSLSDTRDGKQSGRVRSTGITSPSTVRALSAWWKIRRWATGCQWLWLRSLR